MATTENLDKIGIVGATIAALCCLGIPAVIAVVSAIGLSFLLNDAVLAPLLVLSLVLTLWGLAAGWKRHRHALPLVLGGIAGAALFITSYLYPIRLAAYASIGSLVVASAVNVVLLRRMHDSSQENEAGR